jgi:hypothetical protein
MALTPKGQRSFFSKNTSKLPFLAQEAQTKKYIYIFAFLAIRSCPRLLLLGEHVQKVMQKLIAWIGKERFFSLMLGRERRYPFFAKKQVFSHNF